MDQKKSLKKQINHILQTGEESLYDVLHQAYEEEGTLPKELLTEEVLARLFIDEIIIDQLTAELFGMNKKQIARIRQKHGITMNSPEYMLKSLKRGMEKDMDRAIEWMGEKQALEVKEALNSMI
jgi:hypothetical protein